MWGWYGLHILSVSHSPDLSCHFNIQHLFMKENVMMFMDLLKSYAGYRLQSFNKANVKEFIPCKLPFKALTHNNSSDELRRRHGHMVFPRKSHVRQ